MAKAFISSAINIHVDLQEDLICVIHRGLLGKPMILPCPSKHRLCEECTQNLIGQDKRITCPACRVSYKVPSDWNTAWFDRILHNVTLKLTSSETQINQNITRFVENSYSRYGRCEQRLRIKSVELLSNPRLKAEFDKCRAQLGNSEIVTLMHGTTRKAAISISGQGFRIPDSFARNTVNGAEGELKFGKAIYFGEAKKATEYGEHTLIVADCVVGRIQEKQESELQLTPSVVHGRGYHTIHYDNTEEGKVNQEWAIYKPEQCYPLCIIHYEFLNASDISEETLIQQVKKMNPMSPNWTVLEQALLGTENQCKEALRFIGDVAKTNSAQSSRLMHSLLTRLSKDKINSLLKHSSETIRILFLRALWQTGRHDQSLQPAVHRILDWSSLTESLRCGYADVSWRACGVITNMAAVVTDIRQLLVSTQVMTQLMTLLKRGVQFEDKICILTVLHLLSNIAASQHEVMKQKKDILNYVNQNLLDHPDVEIQEAGNRLFCNIIGKGTFTSDWQRGGYMTTQMAPIID